MTFSGALTVLETHLVAAGAALSPAITDVGGGEPGVPPGRAIRWWYEGDGEPKRMGAPRTLNDEMVGERITVRAYWSVPTRDKAPSRALEVAIQLAVRQIRHRLLGDSTLGGNVTDLDVSGADVEWLSLGDAWWRVATVKLVLDMVDIDTIAP